MQTTTPVIFAATNGYDITSVRKPAKGNKLQAPVYTLEKDGRILIIDQALINDLKPMLAPAKAKIAEVA